MHIDHGIEEPTQDLPLIEKPDDKWNPKQEDDVSPSWPSTVTRGCTGHGLTTRQTNGAYQIMIKDDYGGFEVILDVYFPLHVTSL
ncbi:hypothetical protein U9M48_001728 [Paspalum notatum var. saurae]|uniref:Uncharacterized protein n=1 Tax=Paspalum notatum var. saurae TaxID=547442 RepID=A0AAQ3PPD5_PASNO